MNYFASNIQSLRKNLKLKQAEIATAIGFNRAAWGNYETGASVPPLKDLIRIAKYFGITLTELVEDDISNNVGLIEKLTSGEFAPESRAKSRGIGRAKPQIEAALMQLNEAQEPYFLDADVVNQRLKEKDDIIEAQKGQIEALKLAVTQLQQRVQGK